MIIILIKSAKQFNYFWTTTFPGIGKDSFRDRVRSSSSRTEMVLQAKNRSYPKQNFSLFLSIPTKIKLLCSDIVVVNMC